MRQKMTWTFYGWDKAVMASRHWRHIPKASCRVYKDRRATPRDPSWVLEVVYGG